MNPALADQAKNLNPAADAPPNLFHVEQIYCGLRSGVAEFLNPRQNLVGRGLRTRRQDFRKNGPLAFQHKRTLFASVAPSAIVTCF